MRARLAGEHGLLVECDGADQVTATYAYLVSRAAELGAVEVVPAARTVLLAGLPDPIAVRDLLADQDLAHASEDAGERVLVELATRYDGEDLDEVARQWEVSTAEVVRIHQACEFTVLFCGFAPGFAYCTGRLRGRSPWPASTPLSTRPPRREAGS